MTQTNASPDVDNDPLSRRIAVFLRAAMHELNTPLAVLQNYTELVASHLSDWNAEGYLAVIRRELVRLASVVDDLGLRSALESKAVRICLEPLDVERLLPDVAVAVEAQNPERLVVFCYDGHLPCLNSDPNHLRHILGILLHNAVGYAPNRYPMIEMDIQPEGGAALIFRVRDNAPTLWPAYGEVVFEPFPELPRALGRPKFGLGLRLYAARELARRMGGDLWVEPAKGRRGRPVRGNAFVLRLPLAETTNNERCADCG